MIPHLHPHAGDCEHACCLKIEHLSVRIGGEAILDDINLHMHCGQMVALIGPNGAGKSTLIRAILGQRDYEGKITFHEASGKQTKLRIGYVPQSPAFDRGDPVSVMDLFTCCIFRRPAFLRPTKAMREKVLACLENVHGEALIDKRIGALSGGELRSGFDFVDGAPEGTESGMYATVFVKSGLVEDALVVPANAIYTDESGRYVYLINGDTRTRQAVSTGRFTTTLVQITDGLKEGDLVYVKE